MLNTLIALALASSVQPTDPELRVRYGDLDLSRPEHAREFAGRVRSAADAFCERHRELVTPQAVGDPQVCRRGMSVRAAEELPWEHRRAFVRNGGSRLLRKAG